MAYRGGASYTPYARRPFQPQPVSGYRPPTAPRRVQINTPRGAPRSAPPVQPAAQAGGNPVVGYSFSQDELRYTDVAARYPKLFIPQDFYRLSFHWTNDRQEIPTNKPITFKADQDSSVEVPEAEASGTEGEGTHTARVVLLNGAPTNENIKFLVSKAATGGGVKAIGGTWSKAKDGGKPEDDATMIKVAKRHCLQTCGVDLSACDKWIKFFEVEYRREDGRQDRTVIFIPNVWEHLAEGEIKVMKQVSKTTTEVKEEKKVEGSDEKETVTSTRTEEVVVTRSMELSLKGILQYDQQDKDEATIELSLFGELFCQMRAMSAAPKAIEFLTKKRAFFDETLATAKRKREEETADRAAKQLVANEERAAKRQKLEEERKEEAERLAKSVEEEMYMTHRDLVVRREAKAAAAKEKAEEEAAKRKAEADKLVAQARAKKEEMEAKQKADAEHRAKYKTVTHKKETIDEESRAAFQALDRAQPGTRLTRDTLAGLLYGMGTMSRREVEAILRASGLSVARAMFDYVAATTTTEVTTEEVEIEEKKEEVKKEEGGEEGKEEVKKEEKKEVKKEDKKDMEE